MTIKDVLQSIYDSSLFPFRPKRSTKKRKRSKPSVVRWQAKRVDGKSSSVGVELTSERWR